MNLTISAELLKIRKRWMPYVLFILTLIGVTLLVWAAYEPNGEDGLSDDEVRIFVFPYSISVLLFTGQFWGNLVVAILAASVVATEYNWGTVRLAVVRGQDRISYLVTKLLAISLVCAAGLLAAFAVGVLFSVWATAAAGLEVTLDVPGGPTVPEIFLMIVRAALCIIPYGMLAFALATVGRSTTLGIAGTFVFVFAEPLLQAIFDALGGELEGMRDLLPLRYVSALSAENLIGAGDYPSTAPRETPDSPDLPDPNLAALVLISYSAGLFLAALAVFTRRDLSAHQ
jgi:ABC-type transport system involved in multi-copper enzyme maturation permease subunit